MNEPESSSVKPKPIASSRYGFAPPEALLWGMYLGVVFTALVSLALTNGEIASWKYWQADENKSEVLRNLGLVTLGIIGLPLAIWRSMTAFRQSETANRQADLAEKGLIIDRYQKGAQMLESNDLSVRLAGIYALRELAQNDPNETYIMVQDLMFDFVRERSKNRRRIADPLPFRRFYPWENIRPTLNEESFEPLTQDLQKALEAASWLRNRPRSKNLEAGANWKPDLKGANLFGANLEKINLFNADLYGANLNFARARMANFSSANLSFASLKRAALVETNFSGSVLAHTTLEQAHLGNADLNNSNFSFATLKQVSFVSSILSRVTMSNCDLQGTQFVKTDLSNSQLHTNDFSNAIVLDANFTNAAMVEANISEARIEHATLSNGRISKIWAYEDSPPIVLQNEIEAIIVFRNRDEEWTDFIRRIQRERPELGW